MTPRLHVLLALSLLTTSAGCVDVSEPDATDGDATGSSGTPDPSDGSTSTGGPDTGESSTTTDATTGEESSSEGDASTGDTGNTPSCDAPPLLTLDEIPDDPSLAYPDPGDTVATFEVMGHQLIGKHVIDEAAAEGGLRLWQELTLRIPENQLGDLVQLDIYTDTDPVAYFNRTGSTTTERQGLKLGFSTENFTLNDPDPCAPLEPRRGTFDWSLVHEFGHLRGFVDLSWPRFLTVFPDVRGEGDGYPEDGSPILTGDFVTSYAERADGDEDYAEVWTTYVMLPDSALPPPEDGESLALQKLRWIDAQPGLRELRQAMRVTESDATALDVPPAPALDLASIEPGNAWILAPFLYQGTWRESPTDGLSVTLSADDIVIAEYEAGVEVSRVSLAEAREGAGLMHFLHNTSPSFAYSYVREDDPQWRHNHDFFLEGQPEGQLLFARERYDVDGGELEFLPEVILTRVE